MSFKRLRWMSRRLVNSSDLFVLSCKPMTCTRFFIKISSSFFKIRISEESCRIKSNSLSRLASRFKIVSLRFNSSRKFICGLTDKIVKSPSPLTVTLWASRLGVRPLSKTSDLPLGKDILAVRMTCAPFKKTVTWLILASAFCCGKSWLHAFDADKRLKMKSVYFSIF